MKKAFFLSGIIAGIVALATLFLAFRNGNKTENTDSGIDHNGNTNQTFSEENQEECYKLLIDQPGCGPRTAETIINKVTNGVELTTREQKYWDAMDGQ
tara:strand:- start:147 stop:440 length:294 start_codon:yes stop_codon:yes gene_type:complete